MSPPTPREGVSTLISAPPAHMSASSPPQPNSSLASEGPPVATGVVFHSRHVLSLCPKLAGPSGGKEAQPRRERMGRTDSRPGNQNINFFSHACAFNSSRPEPAAPLYFCSCSCFYLPPLLLF